MSSSAKKLDVPTELDILASLRRHPVIAILAPVMAITLAVLVILFAPRKYSSETRLLLKIGRESVSVDPTAATAGDPMNMHITREHEIQSAISLIKSRQIIADTIQDIGPEIVLDPPVMLPSGDSSAEEPGLASKVLGPVLEMVDSIDPIPDDERAIREFQENLSLEGDSESSVVSVSYRTKNPEVAQRVLRAWLDNYIEGHANAYNNPENLAFFQSQDDKIAQELKTAREELRDAKNKIGIVSVEGERNALEARKLKLETQLSSVITDLAAAAIRIRSLEELRNEQFEATVQAEVKDTTNSGRETMRSRLFDLEVQQKDLESRLRAGHPKLVAIAEQVAQARQIVESMEESSQETTDSINPFFQQLKQEQLQEEANRRGLVEKQTQLEKQLTEIAVTMKTLNGQEGGIEDLDQQVQILEQHYAKHAERYRQAKMNAVLADSEITSVHIIQPPSLQHRPTSPNKLLCAVGGLAAAFCSMLGLPVLMDWREFSKRRLSETPESSRMEPGLEHDSGGNRGTDWDFDRRQKEADREAALEANREVAREANRDVIEEKSHQELPSHQESVKVTSPGMVP